jgi:poly(3-hydroxybutyrate) depolymerase
MRVKNCTNRHLLLAPLGLCLLWGCVVAPDGSGGADGSTASGGSSSSGGQSTATGGSVSSGGVVSSGGGGSGGTSTTVTSTGGMQPATGGVVGSGGRTTGTGGASATGGQSSGTGGAIDSGGAMGSGGRTTGTGGQGSGGQGTGGANTGGLGTGGTTGAAGSSGGYPLANPAVPSAGCGKALSTFKSGANTTYKMASASLNREYIVYIPSNYDASKPYRLVFSMHCMGSSATNSANNEQYYRLRPLDTGNTTIFVAPQGYTDSSPWRGGDNKDHVFFEDMVKLFQSELCIDTSRIFSVGFSFGAMFSNALAQNHQDTLRGVVVYATADYNIYFPANTGKPVAYMGVHGTGDGTCPFKSGKSSIERFVKNNKCTVPATVPEATTSTHVVHDYACPNNYPVKWATHNGGHTDLPKDPNQSTSWAIDMTWKFITQF